MCWDGTVVCCQEDDKMFIYFLWVTTSQHPTSGGWALDRARLHKSGDKAVAAGR